MEPRTYTSEYHDLVTLCQAQGEELAKTNQALADAHGELEDALDDYDRAKMELRDCQEERQAERATLGIREFTIERLTHEREQALAERSAPDFNEYEEAERC